MVSKKPRPRRSAEETRTLMVEAGVKQLEQSGIDVGLDHVTLEAACAVTGVPRSSSHAAWALDDDYTPQAMYRRAVLRTWLDEREGLRFSLATEKALARVFEERGDSATSGDIIRACIQSVLLEATAIGERDAGTGFLSTDMAIKHAVASQPAAERDPDVLEWVRRAEMQNRASRVSDTFRPMAELLNVRPRPEYGDAAYEHIALATACLTEGISLRHQLMPELALPSTVVRPVGPDEEPATLIGACLEALVDAFFEPI